MDTALGTEVEFRHVDGILVGIVSGELIDEDDGQWYVPLWVPSLDNTLVVNGKNLVQVVPS